MFILNYGVKLPLAFTIATITNSIPKFVRKTSHFPQINTLNFWSFWLNWTVPTKGLDMIFLILWFNLLYFASIALLWNTYLFSDKIWVDLGYSMMQVVFQNWCVIMTLKILIKGLNRPLVETIYPKKKKNQSIYISTRKG